MKSVAFLSCFFLALFLVTPARAQCLGGAPAGYAITAQILLHVVDPECSFDTPSRKHLADPSVESVRVIYSTTRPQSIISLVRANPSAGQKLLIWSLDGKVSQYGSVTNPLDVAGDFSAFVITIPDASCGSAQLGSAVTPLDSKEVAGFVRKTVIGASCTLHVIKPSAIQPLAMIEPPRGAEMSRLTQVPSPFPLFAIAAPAPVPANWPTEQPKATTTKATVYVYRYSQYYGKAVRPSVFVNGRDVARIQSGRYVALALDPGRHTFSSNDRQAEIELDVASETTYFLRVDIATGVLKGHGRLVLMMKEQGAAEIRKVQPASSSMIKDTSLLSPDFAPRN